MYEDHAVLREQMKDLLARQLGFEPKMRHQGE
jgi:hypothetical protein